jgi:hypothetical protein
MLRSESHLTLLPSKFSSQSPVLNSEILATGIVHAVAVAIVSARAAGTKGDGHGVHLSERGGGESCRMVRNGGSQAEGVMVAEGATDY